MKPPPERTCCERTCCGCQTKRTQSELLRLASQNGAAPRLDVKANGRGAYLCFSSECAKKAWKRRAIERALKLQVPLDAAFKEQVEAAIETVAATQIISQESQNMN